MAELTACCGLACRTCPIYLATREKDSDKQAQMRAGIARLCNEKYGLHYRPEDITECDGCRGEGRLFAGSAGCGIRRCARERRLDNCAACAEYACGKLEEFFATEPSARHRLDEISAGKQ